MSINFEVSKHTFLDGLHLKAEFENGYEVSIVPTFAPIGAMKSLKGFEKLKGFETLQGRVELGIWFEGTMISTFSDEDLTYLTPSRAFEICEEVKDLNPNI